MTKKLRSLGVCSYLFWPGLAPGAATGGEAWHCSPADRAWLGGDHVLRYIVVQMYL